MEENCTCNKKYREKGEAMELIHRLNRIEGQIRGIRSMVEQDAYCVEILTQVLAASAALTAFSRELLNNHIRTCVVQDIREGGEEKVEELLKTIQKFIK